MRRSLVFICLAIAALSGCKKNPNSVTDQAALLKGAKTAAERSKAIENLKRIGTKEAAAALAKGLHGAKPKVKMEIAQALVGLKAQSEAVAIAGAMDPSESGKGGEVNAANEKLARALGDLGDPSVAPALLRFAKESADDRVKVEAITALGKLRSGSAVPVLMELATDEKQEFSVNARALQALSAINAPEALPAYFKMLFADRKGTSFYFDAWHGIFRLREAAFDRLLLLLNGRDKECADIAEAHGLLASVLVGKAAEIEGDVQDPRAIPVLEKLLKFTWRDKNHEDAQEMVTHLVRQSASEALGRMRARHAVGALIAALESDDLRDGDVTALVRIGDKRALPKLTACAAEGSWGQRDACLQGVALMGGPAELPLFDRLVKGEKGRFLKECEGAGNSREDCESEAGKELAAREKNTRAYREVIELLGRCSDAACLERGLGAADPVARQRAAYELAHRGSVDSVPALLSAVRAPLKSDADAHPRVAAALAIEWLVERDPAARARFSGELPALQQLIEKESASVAGRASVEDLRRLADILERGRNTPSAEASEPAAAPEPAQAEAPAKAEPAKAAAKGKAGSAKAGARKKVAVKKVRH
jgi:HEAT repeat protein